MTPRLTKLVADALSETECDDHAIKAARAVLKTMKEDPEAVIKWLVKEGILEVAGYVDEGNPRRIEPIGITRHWVPVYMKGLGE